MNDNRAFVVVQTALVVFALLAGAAAARHDVFQLIVCMIGIAVLMYFGHWLYAIRLEIAGAEGELKGMK